MPIAYNTYGQGPIHVMMSHGWLSDCSIFDAIKPLFDPETFTLALVDYRGYGSSTALSGEYTIPEIASDALEIADNLHWDHFHIVGHSMAGTVAQRVCLAVRGRVRSVAAITPVSAAGFAVDEPTLSFFQSAADDDAALAEVFNTLTGHRHARSFLNYLVRKARAGTTKAAFLGYLDAWTTADFSAEAAKLDVPFLVVAGTHDEALGPQHQRETYLKHLSNVRMQVLEGAGHYPMLETPPELFTVVEAFLTENAG